MTIVLIIALSNNNYKFFSMSLGYIVTWHMEIVLPLSPFWWRMLVKELDEQQVQKAVQK